MDEKIKNYLGIVIIITLIAFVLFSFIYVVYYAKSIKQPIFDRTFGVTAEGKAVAVPDVAEFNFSVITQGGKDIGKLQKENTDKANKIIEFLKSSGMNDKDIKTQNYSVDPRYQYFSCPAPLNGNALPCPPPEITGYTINQTVSVKIRDFTKTGDTLSGVVKNGANSVSQLYFKIDDLTVLQNKARDEAIQKAKEKAKSIADAGGFKMGKLLAIDEGVNFPSPIYGMGGAAEFGSTPQLKSPEIQPGSQEVTVSVTLRYEIK